MNKWITYAIVGGALYLAYTYFFGSPLPVLAIQPDKPTVVPQGVSKADLYKLKGL